jgi:hypothetical protein
MKPCSIRMRHTVANVCSTVVLLDGNFEPWFPARPSSSFIGSELGCCLPTNRRPALDLKGGNVSRSALTTQRHFASRRHLGSSRVRGS